MISTNTSSSSTVVTAKAFDILKHVPSVVLSWNLNGDKTKADKPFSLREGIILLTSKSATVMSYSPENLVTSFILKIIMRLNFRVSTGMVMIWAIIEDFFLDYQPNLNIRDLKNNLGNLQIIQYELQRVEFPFWKCVISLSQKKIMAQFHVD